MARPFLNLPQTHAVGKQKAGAAMAKGAESGEYHAQLNGIAFRYLKKLSQFLVIVIVFPLI